MTFKIAAYGVRENEIQSFNDLNKYHYDLKLIAANLTHDNVQTAEGCDAVLLRGNSVGDAQNLDQLKAYGVKYVFTRTVGYNHVDLKAAEKNGQIVAYVPGYSPFSVSELAFSLGLTLQRHIALATSRTAAGDFKIKPDEFATEIHDLTVGIIGTGRIGLDEALLWKGVNARVLGYDLYPSEAGKELLEYVDEDQILAQSDIISLHVPYFPNSNHHYFNRDYVAKMKTGAILVNTARAEITDVSAILDAVASGKIQGFATDVIENEGSIFGKNFNGQPTGDSEADRALKLYPKVLITPHMGSYTQEALHDMISISYENFNDVLTTGTSKNVLKAK
ncbi:NAD(P)-dependent oxidoreductase [Oenococcus kitaharae]|uniref:NAD(P)-dependent oxidoreductase n=1 Tax=Oenococcus TaxID=46254 RepID=UPI0021E7A40C|nr:NAD(P)-dependent oxidoreductase [Oenococcus kitaharae]MCV3296429.1 lactate dehydrogenase [Oenococcus kitaharae]